MAARRLAASSINWTAFAERVPAEQRPFFLSLKTKTDNYLRRVNAHPAEPQKIDWTVYKSKIAIPGLVESFQKQYEAFSVPYPADKVTQQINEQQKASEQEVKQFIVESNQRIKDFEAKIAKWDDVLPYEEMTMEEYAEAHPKDALWTGNLTYWPHTPEEQPGYVEPGSVEASSAATPAKH